MKRKTRIRKEWIPRENNFICGDCNTKGKLGNDLADARKKGLPFYWSEIKQKIICVKCDNWLETKQELEEQIDFKEIQQYGFWLRFMSEHFIPCDKCQDDLHKEINCSSFLVFQEQNSVILERALTAISDRVKQMWRFIITFANDERRVNRRFFCPCKKCQKKLDELWENNELHIGNETKPMVELWRKWELIED